MSQQISIFIDMDDTVFDYSGEKAARLMRTPENAYPQSEYRFYADLVPFEGAVKYIKKLIDDEFFLVDFCTAPSIDNLLSYTEKAECIRRHFGRDMLNHLFLAPDKSRCIGDVLIDDCGFGRGQEKFNGKLIKFGDDGFETWESIYRYLVTTYKGG